MGLKPVVSRLLRRNYPGFFGGGGLLAASDGRGGVTPLSSGLFPLPFSHGGEFGTYTMFQSFAFGGGTNSTISTVSTGIRIATAPSALTTRSSVSHRYPNIRK